MSRKNTRDPDEAFIVKEEVPKESTQRAKEDPKPKGVSSQPHPMDKHSGSGRGKEMRKNGAGKNNWGNYKDDMKDYGEDGNEFPDDEEDYQEQPKDQEPQEKTIPSPKKSVEEPVLLLDEKNFPKLTA